MSTTILTVRTPAEADALAATVRGSAERLQAWMASFPGDGIGLVRALKFDQIGTHPFHGHPLNAIEQINQTWTYLAGLAAARLLLEMHPEAGAMHIAPGAHAAQPLDLMSEAPGLVGAEVFAAVDPSNNRKLQTDLAKMRLRPEQHRYVIFGSPRYPGTQRRPTLERDGVQVWSVDI